jgi:tripartite-type tricarboxylate transporter receptor subunit TctC
MLDRKFGLALAGLYLATSFTAAHADWPERPITIYVPYSAGGGTDATARFFAAGLKEELGVPVNVVNRTGANGLTGHAATANAKPDGYSIGLIAQAIGLYIHQGQKISYRSLTPLALFNFDPAGFQVGPSKAHLKTANDVLADMKKSPETWTLGGGGRMGSWGMAWTKLSIAAGIESKKTVWIAAGGAAPSLAELAGGGIDLAPTSLPEAKGLIDAGKIRALAVMGEKRHPLFPDVPTMKEATGHNIVAGAWRAVAAPAGIPADIRDKLVKALRTVWETKAFKDGMKKFGYGMEWMQGEKLQQFLVDNEKNALAILNASK